MTALALKLQENAQRRISVRGQVCKTVSCNEGAITLWTNVGGNPAAAFDVDVSEDADGGLGSPLGSVTIGREE